MKTNEQKIENFIRIPKILVGLALIICLSLNRVNGQSCSNESIYVMIMDTLIATYDFEYYHKTINLIDVTNFTNYPTDTFEIFNQETYEISHKLGYDLIKRADSINLIESRRYKQRKNHPEGLFLISRIREESLHKNIVLEDHINLPSYPSLNQLNEVQDSILNLSYLGPYQIKKVSDFNSSEFKYSIKALFYFSGIEWDETRKYCIVECGVHFRHKQGGTSGSGCHVIMEKSEGKMQIIKFIKLWEE